MAIQDTQTKNRVVYFSCYKDTQLGAIALREGESIKARSDGLGYYFLFVEWVDGNIGRYSAEQVNELAGEQVVQ
jgi:hypothetical protein